MVTYNDLFIRVTQFHFFMSSIGVVNMRDDCSAEADFICSSLFQKAPLISESKPLTPFELIHFRKMYLISYKVSFSLLRSAFRPQSFIQTASIPTSFHSGPRGSSGAYLSCHGVRGRVHPGDIASTSQVNAETNDRGKKKQSHSL